jgi:hypothetical protein
MAVMLEGPGLFTNQSMMWRFAGAFCVVTDRRVRVRLQS